MAQQQVAEITFFKILENLTLFFIKSDIYYRFVCIFSHFLIEGKFINMDRSYS